MKVRVILSLLAVVVFVFAACSDDDPVAPLPSPPSQFNTSNMPITVPNTPGNYANMSTDMPVGAPKVKVIQCRLQRFSNNPLGINAPLWQAFLEAETPGFDG